VGTHVQTCLRRSWLGGAGGTGSKRNAAMPCPTHQGCAETADEAPGNDLSIQVSLAYGKGGGSAYTHTHTHTHMHAHTYTYIRTHIHTHTHRHTHIQTHTHTLFLFLICFCVFVFCFVFPTLRTGEHRHSRPPHVAPAYPATRTHRAITAPAGTWPSRRCHTGMASHDGVG
jgi:hypothetical protein